MRILLLGTALLVLSGCSSMELVAVDYHHGHNHAPYMYPVGYSRYKYHPQHKPVVRHRHVASRNKPKPRYSKPKYTPPTKREERVIKTRKDRGPKKNNTKPNLILDN
jgi:hypothetical protein